MDKVDTIGGFQMARYTDTTAARAEFVARKAAQTHCKRGHPLTGENLYLYLNKSTGRYARHCKICRHKRQRVLWGHEEEGFS
jgi:hypothetical protein